MPTDSLITRTDAGALIPEDAAREIIQSTTETSAVMRLARRLPNMTRAQRRLPVLNALPTAYFVTGDTGHKQTTEVDWTNVYLNAEELAVIVPVPEAVIDDADYDILGEIRPLLVEAFGKAIDAAVLFGTNAPSSWPDDVRTAAVAAGNNVALGTGSDLYDDLLDVNGVWAKVEADGYKVTGGIAAVSFMSRVRGVRDANGNPIFHTDPTAMGGYRIAGVPTFFPRNGAFNTAATHAFFGDWSQIVYAIRQDITYKILTEAVITNQANEIVYNLAQQDMVALRAVIRLGFAVPNPINQLQATAASRYPIGVLTT